MQNLRIENRKLSAWLGSLAFHAVLLLLVLFWFSFPPVHHSAPGERHAIGGIALQSAAETSQPSGIADDSPSADSDTTDVLEKLSNLTTLSLPLPTLALAPGQNVVNAGTEVRSAADLTGSLSAVGNGAIGNQSGKVTVTVFGKSGTGTKFMYVFDSSGSMEGIQIRSAKAELIKSLDSLGDLHQFNVLFYSSKGQQFLWQSGRKLVFASATEKEDARRFVERISAAGGTWHFDPLKEAIAHRPDVIFFLTDGDAKDDLTTLQLNEIERLNSRGAGAQINVIQFGSGSLTDPPSLPLQQLAAQNHGEYQYVNVTELK